MLNSGGKIINQSINQSIQNQAYYAQNYAQKLIGTVKFNTLKLYST